MQVQFFDSDDFSDGFTGFYHAVTAWLAGHPAITITHTNQSQTDRRLVLTIFYTEAAGDPHDAPPL